MSKEKDKIAEALEDMSVTFDELGYSPTIPVFKGHQDFNYIFKIQIAIINNESKQKDKKITDLEAKLADSESKLRVSNSHLASSQLEYNQLKKKYDEQEKLLSRKLAVNSELQFEFDQLKQQLAEKTLTIEQINKAFMENRSLWKGKYERVNQDKISFCIEQLEKVKSELVNEVSPVYLSYTEYVQEVFNKINRQIKKLKEMK